MADDIVNVDSQRAELPADPAAALRAGIGLALVALGLLLGGWTFLQIRALVTKAENPPLVARLIPYESEARTLAVEGTRYEIPTALFTLAATLIFVLLLSIVGGLAVALIRAGTDMFQPTWRHLIRNLAVLQRTIAGRSA